MRNATASAGTGHGSAGAMNNERHTDEAELDLGGLTDIERLGRIGQAVRYRALQPTTGRPVEVLVLDGRPGPATVQSFVRDGTIGARLSGQSGVIPIFDVGVTSSGRHYLVRPYYSRGSLGRLMNDSGPLGWRDAVHLVEQIAVTTAEIHGWGIVHQGLEPGNIMLTEFLGPRVGAFSSSLPVGADIIVGANPAPLGPYAASELTKTGEASATADVFSLGAILWALLAGRDPDPAAQPVPEPAPGVPPSLMGLLRRSMSRRVHERPTTAASFVAELRRSVAAAEEAAETGPAHRQNGASHPAANGAPSEGAGTGSSPSTASRPQAARPAPIREERIGAQPEARYILALVGIIGAVILLMVAAAIVAV